MLLILPFLRDVEIDAGGRDTGNKIKGHCGNHRRILLKTLLKDIRSVSHVWKKSRIPLPFQMKDFTNLT